VAAMTADDEPMQTARRLVAEALNRPPAEIPPDGTIHSIPAWDSLGHVRVLMALESAIGGPLPSDTIGTLASIADVAAVLSDNALAR